MPFEKSDKVVINVSGRTFQTWRTTLRKHPNTLLGSDSLTHFYDSTKKEYFFDRDPNIFRHVLSFYQVGKLHLSFDDCWESVNDELAFYGISTDMVHECCWECIHEVSPETRRKENCRGGYTPSSAFLGSRIRRQIWSLFNQDVDTWPARIIQYAIGVLICLSVLCAILASLKCTETTNWEACYHEVFQIFDMIFLCAFTTEFLLRLFATPNMKRFFEDKINILDLIAVIPLYVDLTIHLIADTSKTGNMDVLDIFRVLRCIRILKLGRHSKHMRKFGRGLKKAVFDLGFLYFAFFLANIFFASCLYTVEELQGFETYRSIPESMWYTVVTMMTLGYGDIVPSSIAGKIIGALCCIFGIIILALPVPILQHVED